MFCQHCGTQIVAGNRFCTKCGQPIIVSPAAVAPRDPQQALQGHIRIIAVLWTVYSVFRILMAGWTIVFSRLFLPMWTQMIPPQANFNFAPFLRMISGIYWFSGMFAVAVGVLGLWAAWSLWQRDPIGRTVAIIVAFISLISVPLGTALGVYTLVILLPSAAAQHYARLTAPA